MARRGRVRYDPVNDYYLILGVGSDATPDEIQSAFRQRAKQLHPDRNPDWQATAQFQRLSEAYDVLGDPASRAVYDTLREIRAARRGAYSVPPKPAAPLEQPNGRAWIARLWNGPYRYVVLVLILVVMLNVVLVIATDRNRSADTSLPPTPTTPFADNPTTTAVEVTTVANSPFLEQCGSGDQSLASINNAVSLKSGFTLRDSEKGMYQLDWAPVIQDTNGSIEPFKWAWLSGPSAISATNDLLDSRQMNSLIAALPRPSQVVFRLTVLPTNDQPVAQCEIVAALDK
ncbi:MAG: J domain-containing protein [Aggregatilineales bacterium]